MMAASRAQPPAKLAILFVCMGNICRSPTAEAVFRAKLTEAGLADLVEVDSAGTHAYHVGDQPDPRSVAAAARRGYDMQSLRARQLSTYDAERFDYVLVMDKGNYNTTLRALGGAEPGEGQRARVRLFLEFAPGVREVEVPDPYVGGPEGFEHVLDLIEAASDGLLAEVRARLEDR
ncbi:MAG: low molecular weight phosphotyrosine protein phosphatase [Trueperaceae bacterium]|nr:low molecular weight phosphotyrosine protein phosphatase [Trueperaceae bacterium]MCO5174269.1 low molecular weight phosphotyrosine protein phosphatase [Trueperaceae bacterium]MCW5819789.1 low molecular weight phosphotyrosine protein phosphatase [Trueperaceae bacterium]